jgi:hypothetical protein
VTVMLDSPLLLSGSRPRQVDATGTLRGASVRGLMHTWCRALLGPETGGDWAAIQHAERCLLGAHAGAKDTRNKEYGATFRLEVESRALANSNQEFLYCPHDPTKGSRAGLAEGQRTSITIRPRRHAAVTDPLLPGMLWTVLWTGVCLGSLGQRSRRGYGSLRPVKASKDNNEAPSVTTKAGETCLLPEFGDPPSDVDALARQLAAGLRIARKAARHWLAERCSTSSSRISWPLGIATFLLPPDSQIYVGQRYSASSNEAMVDVMRACHAALAHDQTSYRRGIGRIGDRQANGGRMASLVWIRLWKTALGLVPVATFSQMDHDRAAADDLLRRIEAIDSHGGWSTLESLAGSSGASS